MSWRDEQIGEGVSRCPDDPDQRSSVPDTDRRMPVPVRVWINGRELVEHILKRPR